MSTKLGFAKRSFISHRSDDLNFEAKIRPFCEVINIDHFRNRKRQRYSKAADISEVVSTSLPVSERFISLLKHGFTDSADSRAGLYHRMGSVTPGTNPVVYNKFLSFTNKLMRLIFIPIPGDTNTNIDHYCEHVNLPGYKIRELQEKFKQHKEGLPKGPYSKIEVFTKEEWYTAPKPLRKIFPRVMWFRGEIGPIVHKIEEYVFSTPYFFKRIPVDERASVIIDKFEVPGYHVYVNDVESWERSISPIMLEVEFMIIDYLCSNLPERREFMSYYKMLRGKNVLVDGPNVMTIKGCRMSGEMNTSLGNSLMNLFLNWFTVFWYDERVLLDHSLLNVIVEGDDALLATPVGITAQPFTYLGFRSTLERVADVRTASFCGNIFSKPGHIVRNPIEYLAKFGWCTRRYNNASVKTRIALLRGKALSGLYSYPNCPIIGPYCERVLFLTRSYTAKFDLGDDKYKHDLFITASTKPRPVVNIVPESRVLVDKLFGLSPAVQHYYELKIKNMQLFEDCGLWRSAAQSLVDNYLNYVNNIPIRALRGGLDILQIESRSKMLLLQSQKDLSIFISDNPTVANFMVDHGISYDMPLYSSKSITIATKPKPKQKRVRKKRAKESPSVKRDYTIKFNEGKLVPTKSKNNPTFMPMNAGGFKSRHEEYIRNLLTLERPFLVPRSITRPLGAMRLDWAFNLSNKYFDANSACTFKMNPDPDRFLEILQPSFQNSQFVNSNIDSTYKQVITDIEVNYTVSRPINIIGGLIYPTVSNVANFGKSVHSSRGVSKPLASWYYTGNGLNGLSSGTPPTATYTNTGGPAITVVASIALILSTNNSSAPRLGAIANSAQSAINPGASHTFTLNVGWANFVTDSTGNDVLGFCLFYKIINSGIEVAQSSSIVFTLPTLNCPNINCWEQFSIWDVSSDTQTCKLQYESAAQVCVTSMNLVCSNVTATLNENGTIVAAQIPAENVSVLGGNSAIIYEEIATIQFNASKTMPAKTGLAYSYLPTELQAYGMSDVEAQSAGYWFNASQQYLLCSIACPGTISGQPNVFSLKGRLMIELDTNDKSVALRYPPTNSTNLLQTIMADLGKMPRFCENPKHLDNIKKATMAVIKSPLFRMAVKDLGELALAML